MSDAIVRFMGPYRFLSNFWPSSFRYDGKLWMSVEHAFQATKTEDKDSREAIRLAPSPGVAKKMGRKVTLREDWDKIRVDVMRGLLRAKFADEVIRGMLLSTGNAHLEEGNTWGDTFWGTCGDVGENWLGKLLMELRDEYRMTRCDHCNGKGSVHINHPDDLDFDPRETSFGGPCPRCKGKGKVKRS